MKPVDKDIRRLLDRYYDGTATTEEVRQLTDFFRLTDNVSPDLETDRKLFLALASEQAVQADVPAELSARLKKIGRPRVRILDIAAWGLGAAAVIAALFVTEKPDNSVLTDVSPALTPVMSEVTAPDTSVIEVEEMTERADTVMRTDGSKAARRRRPVRRQRFTEEEKRVGRHTVELINRSLAKVNLASAALEKSIENVDNTLNDL